MDAFKTPGAFSWCELMTPDPAAATEFYGSLLGWTFETMDMGSGPYRVVKIGEEAVGGVMALTAATGPMPPAWGCYVTVLDTDATARKAADLGGKVLVPPTDIPGVGRFAVLQDPQGAVLSVIAYVAP